LQRKGNLFRLLNFRLVQAPFSCEKLLLFLVCLSPCTFLRCVQRISVNDIIPRLHFMSFFCVTVVFASLSLSLSFSHNRSLNYISRKYYKTSKFTMLHSRQTRRRNKKNSIVDETVLLCFTTKNHFFRLAKKKKVFSVQGLRYAFVFLFYLCFIIHEALSKDDRKLIHRASNFCRFIHGKKLFFFCRSAFNLLNFSSTWGLRAAL
jgi:hypothetical protein